jgi:hypothetical protein
MGPVLQLGIPRTCTSGQARTDQTCSPSLVDFEEQTPHAFQFGHILGRYCMACVGDRGVQTVAIDRKVTGYQWVNLMSNLLEGIYLILDARVAAHCYDQSAERSQQPGSQAHVIKAHSGSGRDNGSRSSWSGRAGLSGCYDWCAANQQRGNENNQLQHAKRPLRALCVETWLSAG